MVVYKKYSMNTYLKFFHTNFSSNFGITIDQIVTATRQAANAKPEHPLNRWGITDQQLRDKYIPFLKSHLYGGYAMFLEIVNKEGGGAANWINHFVIGQPGSSNDPLQAMLNDINYIKLCLYTYNLPVARSAKEVLNYTPYVPDTPGEDTKTLASCKKGTIGRYYIPSTMAGNAWVFGTAWCTAHWTGSPPGVYFDNPYDDIIDDILKDGGKIDGKGGKSGSRNGKGSAKKQAEFNAQYIITQIQRALKFDIHDIAGQQYYQNAFITATRTYGNTYHLGFRKSFLKNIIAGAGQSVTDHDPDNKNSDNFNDGSTSSTKWFYPIKDFKGYTDIWGIRSFRINSRNPSGFHDGVDIGSSVFSADRGIYAVHAGKIVYTGYITELDWVIIEQIGKYYVWYQEFSFVQSGIIVNVGQTVSAKQKIGNLTRIDRDAHVHIGITKESDINTALHSAFTNNGTWLNPAKFLRRKW